MSEKVLQATLMNAEAANALTADRYSQWVKTKALLDVGFAIHVPAAGAAVGTWIFEGSNDAIVIETENAARPGVHGASSAAKKFTVTPTTVHGGTVANAGTAQDIYVAFDRGLPSYMRCWFDWSADGSSATKPTVLVSGRG